MTVTPSHNMTVTPSPNMTVTPSPNMTVTPSPNMTVTPSHNMTVTPSHNMTVTPSQTIPTPPVTPTPTPTPTSTPIHPKPGNFTVTKNHTVCLFAYMAATFDVPMNISKVWKYLFALFSNGSSLQQILNITMFRVLVIMNDFIYPSTGKMYGKEPLYNETLL